MTPTFIHKYCMVFPFSCSFDRQLNGSPATQVREEKQGWCRQDGRKREEAVKGGRRERERGDREGADDADGSRVVKTMKRAAADPPASACVCRYERRDSRGAAASRESDAWIAKRGYQLTAYINIYPFLSSHASDAADLASKHPRHEIT